MKQIANNFNEFLSITLTAVQNTLNTDLGQQLTTKLLDMKLAENPNMTQEEWNKTKEGFIAFCFHSFLKENPDAYNEFATHMYNELRKEV